MKTLVLDYPENPTFRLTLCYSGEIGTLLMKTEKEESFSADALCPCCFRKETRDKVMKVIHELGLKKITWYSSYRPAGKESGWPEFVLDSKQGPFSTYHVTEKG